MTRHRMMYWLAIGCVVAAGVFVLNRTTRGGYESAEYKVTESDGKFEVREYPDLMLAATVTKIDAQGRDGSFMKLFRYISGANEAKKKIAMTTPVFMKNDSKDAEVQMGFVVPEEIVKAGTPVPTGVGVDVCKRAGGKFAVVRFAGRLNTKLARDYEAKLRAWMDGKGLSAAQEQAVGSYEAAAYDAPYMPGPLRRNEVLIRLQ